ncbi:MAG: hypothetical protein FWB95_06115 [Treponema sp.]|nr:hypothetical protein [Treponema sp.]
MEGYVVRLAVLTITAVFIFFGTPVFAQSSDGQLDDPYYDPDIEIIDGSNNDTKKLYVTFSYGATFSWLTRIIDQTSRNRSNFVLKDFFPGVYFTTELQNPKRITPEIRLAAYYPLVSTFNDMPQKPKLPLHYAVDFFAGARFGFKWSFFSLAPGLGLHFLFLNSERWNYINLGVGAVIGVEFAISPKLSLLLNGMASFDNGNLGGNRLMEPFNITYQYQANIGVRYSKKKRNTSVLFIPKKERVYETFDR